MLTPTLLVELLTEELPPKSLRTLGETFARSLEADLRKDGFLTNASKTRWFATPRRLAVSVSNTQPVAPDKEVVVKGPSVKIGLDNTGQPTQALLGFAKKRGVSVDQLARVADGKQEIFVHRDLSKGGALETNIDLKIEYALKSLPIAKRMRWGGGDAEFVRPVHNLLLMLGEKGLKGTVLGLTANTETQGHRFLAPNRIRLEHADEYESKLKEDGYVIADFNARRSEIERQLVRKASDLGATLQDHESLLDEVTALVEYPEVCVGSFEARFLKVPHECLTLTMRQNQKYFPLLDDAGRLQPKFLIVSNIRVADPRHIVAGNERVVRPRLEDARFFYDQDRKVRLESRVPELARVVYHNKLGSQLERVERIQLLSGSIARTLKIDHVLTERAAWLAKADLLTGMVGEFPELQGVMGRYYALHDGEPEGVANAIEAHYRPRFAGDDLPKDSVSSALALADKLDALAGFFGIGQTPTGDGDPFGLRRAALGVIRILVERQLSVSLFELVKAAFVGFKGKPGIGDAHTDLEMFIFDRARGYFLERGYTTNEVESVLCLNPASLDLVPRRLEAVRAFSKLPEAESLAAANKRIGNILKQAKGVPSNFDIDLMVLTEEKVLATAFKRLRSDVDRAFQALDYTTALKTLASLKGPVDAFFDKVMVMDKDARVRDNRIGFLGTLHGTMNRIADLSKLAK